MYSVEAVQDMVFCEKSKTHKNIERVISFM